MAAVMAALRNVVPRVWLTASVRLTASVPSRPAEASSSASLAMAGEWQGANEWGRSWWRNDEWQGADWKAGGWQHGQWGDDEEAQQQQEPQPQEAQQAGDGDGLQPVEEAHGLEEQDPPQPIPVEFTVGDVDVWEVMGPNGSWYQCDQTWSDPIYWALQDGTTSLRLPHVYLNKHGEQVQSWYTLDLADINAITQTNESSGKTREMRLMRCVQLSVPPPSPPPLAEQADEEEKKEEEGGPGEELVPAAFGFQAAAGSAPFGLQPVAEEGEEEEEWQEEGQGQEEGQEEEEQQVPANGPDYTAEVWTAEEWRQWFGVPYA